MRRKLQTSRGKEKIVIPSGTDSRYNNFHAVVS